MSCASSIINSGNPIIAGISGSGFGELYPPGMSEHVVLITGYRYNDNDMILIINDPMPYAIIGTNPYLMIGASMNEQAQYEIEYNDLITYLDYKDSITLSKQKETIDPIDPSPKDDDDGGGGGCFLNSLR